MKKCVPISVLGLMSIAARLCAHSVLFDFCRGASIVRDLERLPQLNGEPSYDSSGSVAGHHAFGPQ